MYVMLSEIYLIFTCSNPVKEARCTGAPAYGVVTLATVLRRSATRREVRLRRQVRSTREYFKRTTEHPARGYLLHETRNVNVVLVSKATCTD